MMGEVLADAKKQLFEALVPSHSENFAIVVAEALAHAVPVFASKGTPWSELPGNFSSVRGPIIKIEIEKTVIANR